VNSVKIAFTDGTGWVLEVTRPNAGKARTLAALIAETQPDGNEPKPR